MINQLTGFKGSYVKVETSHGLSVTDIQLNVRQISHYLNFQQVSNINIIVIIMKIMLIMKMLL